MAGLAYSAVPNFLRKSKNGDQADVGGAPAQDSDSAENGEADKTVLAYEAVQIRSLQQKLEKAALVFEEQNKTNEFIVCLYAIDMIYL